MIDLPESKDKRVFNNVLGAMGNILLVKLERIGRDLPVSFYAKLEFIKPRPPNSSKTRRSSYSRLLKITRASRRFLYVRQILSCVLPYTPLAKRSSWFDNHSLVL